MDKEDVEEMLKIAARSKRNSYAVGIGMLVIGIVYMMLGDHAVMLEIIISGMVMFFVGLYFLINGRTKFGILLVVLGLLFEIIPEIFELFHGLEMFLEFAIVCVTSVITALRAETTDRGRFTSVVVAVASGIVAVFLVIEHHSTMDFLMVAIGVVLVVLSIYLLWATKNDKEFKFFEPAKE